MRLNRYLNEASDDLRLDYIQRDCQPYLRDLKKESPVDGLLLSGRKRREAMFKGSVRKNRRPKDTPEEIQELVDDIFQEEFGVRPRSNSMFTISKSTVADDYGTVYFIFPIGNYKIIWSQKIEDFYGDVVDSDTINAELLMDNEIPGGMGDEYEGEYGEDKRGRGFYRGEYFDDRRDLVIDEIVERHETDDMTEDELREMEREIEDELEGVPEKTEEEFKEEAMREKERDRDRLRDVIDDYEIGNLGKALEGGNEIMLMCDGYYAINAESFRFEVLEGLDSLGIKVRAYGRR